MDDTFRDFLSEFSNAFPGIKTLELRFLLHDCLPLGVLSTSSGMGLFTELNDRGHIAYNNVNIMSEIADLTENVSAKGSVNKYKGGVGIQFESRSGEASISSYRKTLYKAMVNITEHDGGDLGNLIGFYNLKPYGFNNKWDVVFHLEKELHLTNIQTSIKTFATRLNERAKRILLGQTDDECRTQQSAGDGGAHCSSSPTKLTTPDQQVNGATCRDGVGDSEIKDQEQDSIFLKFVDSLTKEVDIVYTMVTGRVTETKVLEGLRRYIWSANYVHTLLCRLDNLTKSSSEPRPDIIELMLRCMRTHSMHLEVQRTASACLCNLTKPNVVERVDLSILKSMVELILQAMRNFPKEEQLQKNALIVMFKRRIVQEVDMDYFQACTMTINCLFSFDDQIMTNMALVINASLIQRISTKQTSEFCTRRNVQKLLQIVIKEKADNNVELLNRTFSIIASLSDESPSFCEIFVNENGVELFIEILQSFPNETSLDISSLLNTFSNIAEVENLRHFLLRQDIGLIEQLWKFLEKDFPVSLFTAGIICHLSSSNWGSCYRQRIAILNALHSKILSWDDPEDAVICYTSFSPLFPLLEQYDTPAVQLFAVWTLNYVCTKNGNDKQASDNCSMLQEEGGVDILRRLVSSPDVHPDVYALVHKVLQILPD